VTYFKMLPHNLRRKTEGNAKTGRYTASLRHIEPRTCQALLRKWFPVKVSFCMDSSGKMHWYVSVRCLVFMICQFKFRELNVVNNSHDILHA